MHGMENVKKTGNEIKLNVKCLVFYVTIKQ